MLERMISAQSKLNSVDELFNEFKSKRHNNLSCFLIISITSELIIHASGAQLDSKV